VRILFIGSKGMGVLALEELVRQGAEVAAVVARWDDPHSGQWYPSVSARARELGLPLLQPQDINGSAFFRQIRKLGVDLMFTAFWPRIYRKRLLELASRGSINLHFGPLPRYRGSFPGAWAIIRGERRHGVTIHYMDEGADSGDIVAQRFVDIAADETGRTLYGKCEEAGQALLRETWPLLAAGTAPRLPQREEDALYHGRGYPYGGVVDFRWSAERIDAYIRAMAFPPFPSPATTFRGRPLRILRVQVREREGTGGDPGRIDSLEDGVTVQAGVGRVRLLTLETGSAAGRSIEESIRDLGLSVGGFFGS